MTTQRDRGSSKRWPFTRPMPATSPSAGVRSISSSTGRRRRCAAMTSGPYSTKVPGSQRSSTFSRAVRGHDVLHLHGFHDEELGGGGHGVARRDVDRDDGALHGRADDDRPL